MSPMPQLRVVTDVVVTVPLMLPPVLASRAVRTGTPFTSVTSPVPQMQTYGKTTVTSPRPNSRRAVTGVCRMSVRVSVPYFPLETLGADPTCHSSAARAAEGATATSSTVHRTIEENVFTMC